MITEFLAVNRLTLKDENQDAEDWIEICNLSHQRANLEGWYLTDDSANLAKWKFPETFLEPGQFLVVFASNKDRRTPGARLHTNFRLSQEGEYLALVHPDGHTIANDFAPAYPPQVADVSYGIALAPRTESLVSSGSPGQFWIPENDIWGTAWIGQEFDDSSWLPMRLPITSELMGGTNTSIYVRLPFVIADAANLDQLSLKIQYNAGFVAYLNGVQAASRNVLTDSPGGVPADSVSDGSLSLVEQDATPLLSWNSTALRERDPSEVEKTETIDLTWYKNFVYTGTNLLAIHGLKARADDPKFLLRPELVATTILLPSGEQCYFAKPTPAAANMMESTNLGPWVSEVQHMPTVPTKSESVTVTVRCSPILAAVDSVTLAYRPMYAPEQQVQMRDDGLAGDAAAGDAIFSANIPAGTARPGQMLRYYIRAMDATGRLTRSPAFASPTKSPQYYGTVVWDDALTNTQLPVLHWFIEKPGAANSGSTVRGSLFFEGEFFDNIGINLHGQSTMGFPKKSYDLDFHPGEHFRWSSNAPRVDDLNLLTTWADKTYMRNILAHETYRDAGAPHHFAFPVRVQQNGSFHSVANLVENGDDNMLKRLGLDSRGALYKMYNSAESVSGAEKKTRKYEGKSDLQALINGMNQGDQNMRQAYLFDHLNLPEIINFLAAKMITADTDCCHKNYYLYCDTEGTGEWQVMPWDVDLSFGRVWTCGTPCDAYYDEAIYTNQSIFVGYGNTVLTPVYNTPSTRQMFLRRLRTLMDQWLQPPQTPASEDFYRLKSMKLRDQIAPDAALDLAKWGTWGQRETITQAVNRIWNEFLPGRRRFMFYTQSVTNRREIPTSQPSNAVIGFGPLEYRPASGLPNQEWLSLTNANSYAVDISNWRLDGGVRFCFAPGTVIPAHFAIIISPDIRAFRARSTSPKGGERRLVAGPYEGNLSAWGETLYLADTAGRQVSRLTYNGNPSSAQESLRIVQIMFHPSTTAGIENFADEDFEFIELRNIGLDTIDLRGIRFTEGIQFDFGQGTLTHLAPGGQVFLARNTNAFGLRYGTSMPLAGAYTGNLDNKGERLRLADAFGEPILDFSYDNSWSPLADGLGYALSIVDPFLPWNQWGVSSNWLPILPPHPNRPPVAPVIGLLAQKNSAASLPLDALLSHATDPDGDALAFTGASETSPIGAQVTVSEQQLAYTPPREYQGPDLIDYWISDTYGLLASNRIEVFVYEGQLPLPGRLQIGRSETNYWLRYAGTAGRATEWQWSTNLFHWSLWSQTIVPAYGILETTISPLPVQPIYWRTFEYDNGGP